MPIAVAKPLKRFFIGIRIGVSIGQIGQSGLGLSLQNEKALLCGF